MLRLSQKQKQIKKKWRSLSKTSPRRSKLRVSTDEESGQTIISGMGELHLEIIVDRMLREFKVDAEVGQLQVAYRETIRKAVEQEYKYAKQSGGRGQHGHVFLLVSSCFQLLVDLNLLTTSKVVLFQKSTSQLLKKVVKKRLQSGVLAGYPVEDVALTL